MATFREALPFVLEHEGGLRADGGYVNDPRDAGGETKFGISKRTFPTVDIARLTRADAEKLYERHYWSAHPHLERIADQAVATKAFDMLVNMRPKSAIRILQASVNQLVPETQTIPVDGRLGPLTVARINSVDAARLLDAIRERAAGHYRAIVKSKPDQRRFLRGWLRRAYR